MKGYIRISKAGEARQGENTHHGEISQPMTPGDLHYNIESDEVIASIKHTNIAFAAANVNKLFESQFHPHIVTWNTYISKQFLDDLNLARYRCGFDSIFIQLVLF